MSGKIKYSKVDLKGRWRCVEDLEKEVDGYFEHAGKQKVAKEYENSKGGGNKVLLKCGVSPGGLATWLGIGIKDYKRLCDDDEFKEFHGYMDWVQARMEDELLRIAGAGEYNPKTLDMLMKNRFGFTDKMEKTSRSLSISINYTEVAPGGLTVAVKEAEKVVEGKAVPLLPEGRKETPAWKVAAALKMREARMAKRKALAERVEKFGRDDDK